MSRSLIDMHQHHIPPQMREDVRNRLKVVEGQVHAMEQMVRNDSPGTQILTQIASAREAIHQVGRLVLRNYISRCVTGAMSRGDEDVVDELMTVLGQFNR